MIPLVEFPELVQHYAPHFERVFSPEAFVQFKRNISGLIVSENKTVDQSFGKVRLVINYRQEDLHDSPVFFITNRLHWQA